MGAGGMGVSSPHCAHCKLTRYYFERQAEFDTINHCWGRDVADLINHRQSLKHSSKYAVAFQHEPTYITYKLTVIVLITKGRINNRSKCILLFWLKMKYDKKWTHSGWLKNKKKHKDENWCSSLLYSFIPHIPLPCQNLAPTSPTMQLILQQICQILLV